MVNLWDDDWAEKFTTNVGLITSDGPFGPNVMAAEWTRMVSYSPGYMTIHVHSTTATGQNIAKTKEFGINLASEDQNWVSSIAGSAHGTEVDKVGALKELGVTFYKGKKTKVLMIEGAAANFECKVVRMEDLGDHFMVVGEVVESGGSEKNAILYHAGKYYKIGDKIEKPAQDRLDLFRKTLEKFRKK